MTGGAPRVDGARLRADLTALARLGADPSGGGITRTGFSAADGQARDWYAARARAAGLDLTRDGLGNTFAFDPGADQRRPGVWSGSHLDTVPRGGAFDGAVGAVAALEALRRVKELGLAPARPLRALVFSDEEGNYGSLLGSTGLARGWSRAELDAMTGRDGDRLADALAAWPHAEGDPAATRLEPGALHAFVELHIEQGPFLEAAGTQAGVVTAIAGIGGGRMRFTGRTDHAGTTPMSERADALAAAGEFIARVPEAARAAGPRAVATCGFVHATPGAANVVAGSAEVSLDFRDLSLARIQVLEREIGALALAVSDSRGVAVTWEPHEVVAPAPMDDGVQAAVAAAAGRAGLSSMAMPSGAGHDSQNMARLAPAGMVFIPSVGGRSHSSAELTAWPDIENGANVLLAAMLALAET
ncbi:MAG TPA: Zn-dependent hydrolase [Trebonia sp.]|nr:Zn-dependent hydrolase [Trebonia sp.]